MKVKKTSVKQHHRRIGKKLQVKKSFKRLFKELFWNTYYFYFIIAFILGSIVTIWLSYNSYEHFVLTAKLFEIVDLYAYDPNTLLSQRFTCNVENTNGLLCGLDGFLLAFLILYVEGYSIRTIIKKRKLIQKRYLIIYFLLQQVLLALLFYVYGSQPASVIKKLSQTAKQEITETVLIISNPEARTKLGIIDSFTAISEKIEEATATPTFFEFEPEAEAVLQVKDISHIEKDTLYRSVIIPSFLYASESASIKSQIQFNGLFFPKTNTLIVKTINQPFIEQLAPILAKKLITTNYGEYVKWKKDAPTISVLDDEKYVELMKKREEQRKKDFQNNIQEIQFNIRDIDNSILELQTNIKELESEYSRYESYGRGWLRDCESRRGSSDTFCVEGKKTMEEGLNSLRAQKNEAELLVKEFIGLKPRWIQSLGSWQKGYEDFLKNPVIPEYQAGIFISPNDIFIKWLPKDSENFSYYINTVLHEYLHYETITASNDLPIFLDEGVTDYLTTELTKEFFKPQSFVTETPDYSGYPELIKVVSYLFMQLPEKDLLNAYFVGNKSDFIKIIDNKFGKGVYDQIKNDADQIYYTPVADVDTKMKLVNSIKSLLSEP